MNHSQESSKKNKLVEAGKVSSPHGIKGDVKIHSYLSSAKNFSEYKNFYDKDGNKITIKFKSTNGVHAICNVNNLTDRNDAEKIRDMMIYIARVDMPELEDDFSFYFEDLKNLKILNTENIEIGIIVDVHDFGAGTIIEAKISGKNQMYLLDKTNFPTIDIEQGFVVLNPPEVLG